MPTSLSRLYPSFVQINYHSAYSQHTMTVPTLQWSGTGIGDPGSFETHTPGGVAGDSMVEALVDVLAANMPAANIFDNYTIFNLPTITSDPQPVFGKAYSVTGTLSPATGQAQAVQYTLGFRTTLFGRFQIVLLDRSSGNTWGNVTTPAAPDSAIITVVTSATNGWAGRDGGRPAVFTGISISLNKRLRRKYDMI